MSKLLCIYHHNCADGFGAATLVRYFVGKDSVEFHAGVHQNPPPDVTDREVLFVDFSYKRPVLLEMAAKAKSLTIIDHHKSAFMDLTDLPDNVTTIFDMNHSGVMLTWQHFTRASPPPALIKHIEDRDLWRFRYSDTRAIQACLFSYPYDFDRWTDLIFHTDLYTLIRDGQAIERKHFKDIYEFIEAAADRMIIAGFDVPMLNAPYFWSSDAGHIMAQGEPFAACYWATREGVIFSLRSTDDGEDVCKIAALFGGEGHEHAAGFRIPHDENRYETLANPPARQD